MSESNKPKWVDGAWPDRICTGYIDYAPSGVFAGGFILRDFNHGIPIIGSVHANVFNYPGQTELIAQRLVACWNACVGIPTAELANSTPAKAEGRAP